MIEVFFSGQGRLQKLKKKHMFANLSINRDTENLNIDPIYDCLLKNKNNSQ